MKVFLMKLLLVVSGLCLLMTTCARTTPVTDHYRYRSQSHLSANGNTGEGFVKAADALLKRLLPDHTHYFVFEFIPKENGKDVFEIESREGNIIIRGNNGVSMASGLNWYLKYYCGCHVSLNANQLNLPEPLPVIKDKVRLTSPFRYRNFFNYCTFSYTMAWWDWARWEKMIDYMALNGVNMPLAITGQAAVWQAVLRRLGFNEDQIQGFIAGPAYLPWGWMGNIDGLGGPLPQGWIDSHVNLQQKILARERALGMTPILQGFTGHVPEGIKTVFPQVKIHQTTDWAGMPGTWFLDPQEPLFKKIGEYFIQEQTRIFGTDHLYDVDCFNEINPPTNDPTFISKVGKSVYESMQAADPDAVWVFQGWFLFWQADFWKAPQARALLGAVPDDRMLGLDLYAESNPVWKKTEAFYGKPWVWNVLCNLGQKVNMSGDLEAMQKNLIEALRSEKSGKLRGIGMMMEGFGYNPIVQEFVTEKTWKPENVNLNEWVTAYARRRYGSSDPRLQHAWQLLLEGPYSRNITNGYTSIICYTPKLSRFAPTGSDRFGVGYNAASISRACELLLSCSRQLKDMPTYRFDVTHVTREMLSNLANLLNYNTTLSYKNQDLTGLIENGEIFLQLIRDLDELLSTNENFLLGKWIADARRWGNRAEEKDFYQWNARAIVTMWEPAKTSQLRDYASKQWSGLLSDFYLPRWKLFLDRLAESLKDNKRLDKKKFFNDLKEMELRWIQQTDNYPSQPNGNTLEVAHRLFKKYIPYYNNSNKK
ncbi:MAG: alpha-N-acetylglucosaminidase [Candidatus Aminicenantes bacterium]|nr:alpha-N-acetylglucosaminidase [Candidatus Aminicenantes bacterium]NIN21049.1 alpha-N-acetylglucosaminidase [Candidatus Aminicenantes bacterium]NIN44871.1 alpha-N-acetylglucosaminidase [Candidatus Aminicenantes bacterium]NIN87685.1 alpha-N-acetylglucosaminidase [Candidatus Aminicenantes bacterium]NIO83970.1 alpha-N-acetylglucosaminidase [Candidatus Aminicenantes bacterium]